jgi:hypothetical protein
MPRQYPRELRMRAVRQVAEHRGEWETEYVADSRHRTPESLRTA